METLAPGDRAAFLKEWSLDPADWPDEKILHAMALVQF